MTQIVFKYIVSLLMVLIFWGCQYDSEKTHSGKPLIVSTTGMIADAISVIADTTAEVVGLMGPGVDPHLYKATQNDLRLLRNADMYTLYQNSFPRKISSYLIVQPEHMILISGLTCHYGNM